MWITGLTKDQIKKENKIKNSVKTLLFSALILPCAFVFVGCGNTTPSKTQAELQLAAASEQANRDLNTNPSEFVDLSITVNEIEKINNVFKLTYKETASSTPTTKEVTDVIIKTTTATFEREGTGLNTKIKINYNVLVQSTTHTVTTAQLLETKSTRTENDYEYHWGVKSIQGVNKLYQSMKLERTLSSSPLPTITTKILAYNEDNNGIVSEIEVLARSLLIKLLTDVSSIHQL